MLKTPLHKIQEKHKKAKLVVFDLDGTLTESKTEMDAEMAGLFKELLQKKQVAVIGGGKYEMFQHQLLAKLEAPEDLLKNLFLFPTDAGSFYRYSNDQWQQVYAYQLSREEKTQILEAFEKIFKELNYSHPQEIFGELIEDRGTEIAFSALGQAAPLELKEKWKQEHTQDKLRITEALQRHLPNFSVQAAGYTSIDVTHKGIDKEYGIKKIHEQLGVSLSDMLFVGDALFAGGNDSPALRTGIPCFLVDGPQDTKNLIGFLLEH